MIEKQSLNELSTDSSGENATATGPRVDELAALVRQVGSAMAQHSLTRVDLRYEGLRLTVEAQDRAPGAAAGQSAPLENLDSAPDMGIVADGAEDLHTVTAPMIGTFYVAPAPNEAPFVNVGDIVDEGQTIGIIEAMKIMNEIASDMRGEVVEVVAKNGETVEFGSPLVRLRIAS